MNYLGNDAGADLGSYQVWPTLQMDSPGPASHHTLAHLLLHLNTAHLLDNH